MRIVKLLIILCVFLATFLVGGIALADDSGVLASVTSGSTLEAPKLTITIDGTKVTLSWNKVSDATGYVVHYAQKHRMIILIISKRLMWGIKQMLHTIFAPETLTTLL